MRPDVHCVAGEGDALRHVAVEAQSALILSVEELQCFKHALPNPDFVSLFGGVQASAFCAASFALRRVSRLSRGWCSWRVVFLVPQL